MADKKSAKHVIDQEVIEANEEKRKEEEARQAKIDAEVATRTSHFDQDLKERARVVGINPDNFAEEQELAKAVEKLELENNVKKEQ